MAWSLFPDTRYRACTRPGTRYTLHSTHLVMVSNTCTTLDYYTCNAHVLTHTTKKSLSILALILILTPKLRTTELLSLVHIRLGLQVSVLRTSWCSALPNHYSMTSRGASAVTWNWASLVGARLHWMSHLQLTRQARHVDRHRLTSRDRSSSAPHLYCTSWASSQLTGVRVSGLVWGRDRKRHAHNNNIILYAHIRSSSGKLACPIVLALCRKDKRVWQKKYIYRVEKWRVNPFDSKH